VTHSRCLFTLEWTHQACVFHTTMVRKLVRPLSTVDNNRDYTLVYPTVDSGLTITYCIRYVIKDIRHFSGLCDIELLHKQKRVKMEKKTEML